MMREIKHKNKIIQIGLYLFVKMHVKLLMGDGKKVMGLQSLLHEQDNLKMLLISYSAEFL